MEACGSAHHWGRELIALGHEVRLIPPAYVKPFVKRQKNDANDAAAIHETLSRPGLRFVKVRSIANQAVLMQHQRTQLLNGLRGHLAEIGVIAAQGTGNMRALGALIHEGDPTLPEAVRASLMPLVDQITNLDEAIKAIDADIAAQAKTDPVANRLMTIPGIGPVTASALVATVGDPSGFSGPREFAAFLGLVPRQHSSGGKTRLGGITKMGKLFAQVARGGRACGAPPSGPPQRSAAHLGQEAAGDQAVQARRGRMRQQAGAHGLCADEPEHALHRCLTSPVRHQSRVTMR
jgi:transposase